MSLCLKVNERMNEWVEEKKCSCLCKYLIFDHFCSLILSHFFVCKAEWVATWLYIIVEEVVCTYIERMMQTNNEPLLSTSRSTLLCSLSVLSSSTMTQDSRSRCTYYTANYTSSWASQSFSIVYVKLPSLMLEKRKLLLFLQYYTHNKFSSLSLNNSSQFSLSLFCCVCIHACMSMS